MKTFQELKATPAMQAEQVARNIMERVVNSMYSRTGLLTAEYCDDLALRCGLVGSQMVKAQPLWKAARGLCKPWTP